MSKSDRKYVNFSEDHELNGVLKRHGVSASEENRQALKNLAKAAKESHGKVSSQNLTHAELDEYLAKNPGLIK